MRLRNTFKAGLLTTTLLGVCVVYHGANFVRLARVYAAEGSISGLTNKDFSRHCLASAGYIARYLAGHQTKVSFYGLPSKEGLVSLFLRKDQSIFFDGGESTSELALSLKQITAPLVDIGVKVVFLPLPPKQAIESEKLLSPMTRPSAWESKTESLQDPYNAYRALVAEDPTHFVDLHRAYRESLAKDPGEPLYLPAGYHWTSKGIAVALAAALEKLKDQGFPVTDIKIVKETLEGPFLPDRILLHFQLPDLFMRSRRELYWREPFYRIQAKTAQPNRVIFAADSNGDTLRKFHRNAATLLAEIFRAPVIEFSAAGMGASGPLMRMTRSGFAFQPGDVFIHQFHMPNHFTQGERDKIRLKIAPQRNLGAETDFGVSRD